MEKPGQLRSMWTYNLAIFLFFVIPFCFGIWLFKHAAEYAFDLHKAYVSSENWEVAQGTISSISAEQDCGRGGSSYSLDVIYTYQVKSKLYKNSKIWFGKRSSNYF